MTRDILTAYEAAELLRFVPQFPQLFVTQCGTVLRHGIREISQSISTHGYAKVYTGKPHNRMVFVHRLVAMAWCDGYAEGLQVNHRDGNKLNNHASNLEWVTASRNNAHAHASGLRGDAGIGSRNSMARLKERDVAEIKASLKAGYPPRRIANWHKVHPSTVYAIASGRAWAGL